MNINNEIKAQKIRLVGDNVTQGIYSLEDALKEAEEQGLDLVEVNPKSDPPVCKIMDFQKYLYQQKKLAKKNKAANKIEIKEIIFSPGTDENDFQTKVKQAQKFLEHKDKVKATMFFKGRSISYTDQGEKILLRFVVELENVGKAENLPVLEGRRMVVIIAPK